MNHRAGVCVFLIIGLVTVLAVPTINLFEPAIRTKAQLLLTTKNRPGLVKLLFQGDKLVSWLSSGLWHIGISVSPNKAVIGYDGWLHLGDQYGRSISVARGDQATMREEQARAINHSLINWSHWLKTQGVRSMVFMLGPNKSSVYPQTLPAWARPSSEDPLSLLSKDNHHVLDLRMGLQSLATRSAHRLYYKTDTHWNLLGAAHAFVLLGDYLQQQDPTLQWFVRAPIVVAEEEPREGGDLAWFLRIPHQLPDSEVQVFFDRPERFETTVTDFNSGEILSKTPFAVVDFPRRTVHTRTPTALNSRRVLWLKDSFGAGLSPMMNATFDETVQLHYTAGMRNGAQVLQQLVKQWRPDLVIFTVVERNLISNLLIVSPPASD